MTVDTCVETLVWAGIYASVLGAFLVGWYAYSIHLISHFFQDRSAMSTTREGP